MKILKQMSEHCAKGNMAGDSIFSDWIIGGVKSAVPQAIGGALENLHLKAQARCAKPCRPALYQISNGKE